MSNSQTETLIHSLGIEKHYLDAWGNPAEVSFESQTAILKAMGFNLDDDEILTEQVDEKVTDTWLSVLNPVQVNRVGEPLVVALRLPIELVNDEFLFELIEENSTVHTLTFVPTEYELIGVHHSEEDEFQEYAIALNMNPSQGYHRLNLNKAGSSVQSQSLIITPERCYLPHFMDKNEKVWGFNVQLYCLKSQRNWGIGDFTDLLDLTRYSAKLGADYVGINPIHALYPNHPDMCSPYSPSSRKWLNIAYLDVERVPGFDSQSVSQWFEQADVQSSLCDLRQLELVDYEGVLSLKLEGLKLAFADFQEQHLAPSSELGKVFLSFVEQGGDSLRWHCAYEAIHEQVKEKQIESWGWPVFPEGFKTPNSLEVETFVSEHGEEILFYQFLQWQSFTQLERVNSLASGLGMKIGLYCDVAVGVGDGSADVWANQSLFCLDASIGAPPDVLGPLGQSWGLPPMNPEQLYLQAYQPFVDILKTNMAQCGAIRIDHVMGLLRLWWVVSGKTAHEGGYVYYPLDDLLGILALESQRNQTLVIGEDLGTVPDEIREKLAQLGVFSYRVFMFEKAPDGGFISPKHYPVHSLSSLSTHDMPTLKGYWHCDDLVLGKELGLYPYDNVLAGLYAARHDDKQRILDSVDWHGWLPEGLSRWADNSEMNTQLSQGLQLHLAAGSSALLSLQLEDWLEMDRPVNVPGTFNEYPNWRRKLSLTLEEIVSMAQFDELGDQMTKVRRHASEG